jgi:hypothetical protein
MLRNLILKNLNGKKVLFLFVLTNIVYATMLTVTIPEVMDFSGGIKILDMMPAGYDAKYINVLFDKLGEQGRNAYLYHQLPLDLVYPFLFGISSCLLLAFYLNKLGKLQSNLYYLCWLPLFSGLFDYGENIGIITMLRAFPNHSILQMQVTAVFTILKSVLTSIYFMVLIVTLLTYAKSRLFPKRS